MKRRPRHALVSAAMLLFGPGLAAAHAETCSQDALAAAVDASGAEIRSFTSETQPKIHQKLAALRDAKKWADPDFEEKGLAYIRDEHISSLDTKADELLTKIDTLGRPAKSGDTDCATVNEVKASGSELLAVMKTKFTYMIDKIDREIGASAGAASSIEAKAPSATPAAPPPPAAAQAPAAKPPAKVAKSEPAPLPTPSRKPDSPVAPAPPSNASRSSSWSTSTAEVPSAAENSLPGEPYVMPPDQFASEHDGYAIDEIKEASRTFFGTISTSLASVIEYAFSKSGRPTAYVLGTEGGGAILAGLRYGEGTMYLRTGGTQKVYWHGPSIGSDLGADGSRTLFLIYRMHQPDGIFRQFTGLDGTAYFVGGVGITFLKGGEVLMAPIRSGLGFRLGASIGYVRFTPRPTWNPF